MSKNERNDERQLNGIDAYPDPATAASDFVAHFAEDDDGVLQDALIDATAEANTASGLLDDMGVSLDYIADAPEAIPAPVVADVRIAQRAVQDMAEWLDAFREELRRAAEEMRDDAH